MRTETISLQVIPHPDFHEVAGELTGFCNCCGEDTQIQFTGDAARWKETNGEAATFSWMVCSEKCKMQIIQSPNEALFMLEASLASIGIKFDAMKFIIEHSNQN